MGLGGGGSGEGAGALRGFLREAVGGCAVVDGGLATELEAHGADLHDALWSAKCLAVAPHLIRKVGHEGSAQEIPQEAAAGAGGRRARPNKLEGQAYAELLEESDIWIPAWFSFTSKDGTNAASGDPITECAAVADSCESVAAVGVNCTAPRLIRGLILSIKKVTSKPIVVYPNIGETYIAETKEWVDTTGASGTDFVSCVFEWRKAGAALIGGCCRTNPATVRAIAWALRQADADEYDDVPAVAVL